MIRRKIVLLSLCAAASVASSLVFARGLTRMCDPGVFYCIGIQQDASLAQQSESAEGGGPIAINLESVYTYSSGAQGQTLRRSVDLSPEDVETQYLFPVKLYIYNRFHDVSEFSAQVTKIGEQDLAPGVCEFKMFPPEATQNGRVWPTGQAIFHIGRDGNGQYTCRVESS